MKKMLCSTAMLLGMVLLSATANANLIVNGSFEQPGEGVRTNFANAPTIAGWQSSRSFEIWDLFGLPSYDGFQHLELNASGTGPWSIWQDFETEAGNWYTLSFAAAGRGNSDSLSVELANSAICLGQRCRSTPSFIEDTVELTKNVWQLFTYSFQAQADRSQIKFTSVTPNSSLGNFIDDVRVVPSPSIALLFGMGLLGLALSVRQRKAK
ncbi:DUF642 domain-containing protein [Brumicola nitratireducens]|uniref:Response regulator receiver domain protein (CheY-like) n=1 Tax=Glaciecola nitratireducens (strain JCM 12485 / KCTC 12276 / FR1064) TaxID=1085623 RepID=G4QM82_GLANF|nr:DUF642 domain-containing protein [Glaciecola nitratireducens]AEP30734.1 response regulator receiver domain protein (CheY-like) [Glaciecola nitratireducens FR1064]